MPGKEKGYSLPPDAAALFHDTVVHPLLDLEKHGGFGIIVIEADAQFISILVSVDGGPVKLQVLGIQVQAVHRIGVIRLTDAIFVQFQIRADVVANLKRGFFGNDVLQLKA